MLDETAEARTRAALAAMRLFWEGGAAETAYPAIVEATGLNRRALYRYWPSKEALVLETLGLYRHRVLGPQLVMLGQPGVEGLDSYWRALEAAALQPNWPGCYLLRTAAGEMGHDPAVREMMDSYLQNLIRTFVTAIRSAQAERPPRRVPDPKAAAWQATGLVALASSLGVLPGGSAHIVKIVRAGRLACGLPVD